MGLLKAPGPGRVRYALLSSLTTGRELEKVVGSQPFLAFEVPDARCDRMPRPVKVVLSGCRWGEKVPTHVSESGTTSAAHRARICQKWYEHRTPA